MFPWLVADIGGTNARFSLVTAYQKGASRVDLSQQTTYATAEFPDFANCLETYLSSLEGPRPVYACLAVAGPVGGDLIQLTNLKWRFSIAQTCQHFSLKQLVVINDFAALACSIPYMGEQDFWSVYSGSDQTGNGSTEEDGSMATKVIVGPGTGLGVAALIKTGNSWLPLAGEGGHHSYSPQSDRELEVYRVLRKNLGYVCVENVLSGMGLVNLYQALAEIEGRRAENLPADKITELALTGEDKIAKETLDIFCAGLGNVCGTLALIYGGKGGVYLGGGILPRMKEVLLNSDFLQRFKNRGVSSHYMDSISVQLLVHQHPALIGAAAWLGDVLERAGVGNRVD